MALVYITNGKIVLPDEVVCGKALALITKAEKLSDLPTAHLREQRLLMRTENTLLPDSLIFTFTVISVQIPATLIPRASELWRTEWQRTVLPRFFPLR